MKGTSWGCLVLIRACQGVQGGQQGRHLMRAPNATHDSIKSETVAMTVWLLQGVNLQGCSLLFTAH